jgi:hypothetical protein
MKKLMCAMGCLIVSYFAPSAWAQTAPLPAEEPASVSPALPADTSATPTATVPKPITNTGPKLSLMLSPYTYHFNYRESHRPVRLIGLEREYDNGKLDGVVLFSNSFGQPSIYVYPWGGVYKSIFGVEKLSYKWTGGVIWGYKGEFKDEVANIKGFAPVLIFGLTYKIKPGWEAQMNVLGKAALQFQVNAALD